MKTRIGWLMAVCVLATAGSAQGQVVQLPTFQFFTVNTTVSVPDRGGMLLGGVSRSSQSRLSTGVPGLSKIPGAGRLFTNHAIGSEVSAGGLAVSATIHNRDEMDADLLAAAAGRTSAVDVARAEIDRKADFLSAHFARPTSSKSAAPTDSGSLASVAAIRQQNDLAKERLEAEARELFEQGQQAEADGKRNVAKVFYQMASRRSIGIVKEQASARLAEFSTSSARDAKVAQRAGK